MKTLLMSAMTAEQRTQLVEDLDEIIGRAESRRAATGSPATTFVDNRVARWSVQVPSPADVLALVAEVRASTPATLSSGRKEILDRVEVVGVASVADRQVREALTDPLTGLPTRARIDEEVQPLIAAACRSGSPLTAVMIDVDGLKQVNDLHGHHAGDEVIASVGHAIVGHVRRSDRAYRWGGDEFAVFMANTSVEAAEVVADRILASSATSVSFGIAPHSLWAADTDIDAWLRAADRDLYRERGERRLAAARPSFLHARVSGPAVLALATVAAAAAGWFGASSFAPAIRTSTSSTVHTQALAPVPLPGRAVTPRHHGSTTAPTARPGRLTPAALAMVAPASTPAPQPVLAPVSLRLPVTVPVTVPTAVPPVVVGPVSTPTPAPTPPGLVTGVLDLVGAVLTRVV